MRSVLVFGNSDRINLLTVVTAENVDRYCRVLIFESNDRTYRNRVVDAGHIECVTEGIIV